MTVHVHAPAPTVVKIVRSRCPTCECRTYFVVSAYEWYGPNATCLKCGERFNEDGRAERPFAPRWRAKSIARAKAHYRRHRGENDG